MKYELDRASKDTCEDINVAGSYEEEHGERRAVSTKVFKREQERGFYRDVKDIEHGKDAMTSFTSVAKYQFINLGTLEDLHVFMKTYGSVIMGESDLIGIECRIMIYDDDIE